jgi:hypothetical protein
MFEGFYVESVFQIFHCWGFSQSKNQVEPTPAAVVNDDDINDAVHPAYEVSPCFMFCFNLLVVVTILFGFGYWQDPDMLRAESLKHEAHALAGQLKHKVQRIELFFS